MRQCARAPVPGDGRRRPAEDGFERERVGAECGQRPLGRSERRGGRVLEDGSFISLRSMSEMN